MERIAIIGVGRIGVCLGLNLERAGYDVLGIDKDPRRVTLINERHLRTPEPGVEDALGASRAFRVDGCIQAMREYDPSVIFVAVDTPTAAVGGYDHTQIDRVLTDLFALNHRRERVELALVCTTMPGYCDSKSALAMNRGFALSYTPGFVAQGSILHDQQFPDEILIGEADAMAGDRLAQVLRKICRNEPPIHRMSPLSAEIAKLALNCALTMKIAFANAVGDLATCVGAEPERVLEVLGADTRIGSKFLKYGFGFGGPCFPRDNRALNLFAKQHNCELLQADVTDEMNRRHLEFQLQWYLRTHNENEAIHFDSATYKRRTEMLDESQPLALAVQLARAGRTVVIHESPEVITQLRTLFGDLFQYRVRDD